MHSGDFITLSSFWYLFLPLLDDVNLSEAEKTQFIIIIIILAAVLWLRV